MLCKIGGFHDDEYEECRLLGYNNPVPSLYLTGDTLLVRYRDQLVNAM
jgi:hypothetical protein